LLFLMQCNQQRLVKPFHPSNAHDLRQILTQPLLSEHALTLPSCHAFHHTQLHGKAHSIYPHILKLKQI
jgi:hypothetical protein